MDKHFGWWVDLSKVTLSDSTTWVHALPFGKYQHPLHGEMRFDAAKLTALANSVKSKVRGIDPDIDYDHKTDPAKGHQAAGWVKDARVDADGLHLQVDFTTDATTEIKEKKYRYFSAEFVDSWQDPQGVVHQDVLLGGGLTNRPYMKNLLPVNLSELRFDEPSKEEQEVDGKKLRIALGLAETTTDDEVFAKLGELGKAVTTLTEDKKKTDEQVTKLTEELEKAKKGESDELDPELKKLVEASPAFAKLMESLETQKKQNSELQASVRLAEVTNQIAEVQKGKAFALSPLIKEEIKNLLLKASPEAGKQLTEVLGRIVNGQGLVDLSERGFTGQRGEQSADATRQFNEAVKALMETDKNMGFADAVEQVARMNPRLFNEYRESSYQFKA
jgi:phage I-like protein